MEKTLNKSKFEYTDEQLAAIRAPVDEAVKVAAGAGTGKTTVLVERYRYLVQEKGFRPENILALTFTKKAAGELRNRIAEKINDDYIMMRARIDTFDAFWYRLLIDNPYLCGIDSDFSIIDDTDIRFIREAVIDDMITGSEKEFILKALQDSLWIQKDAADRLGISPRALNYKIKKFGITHPRWRKNK